MRSGGRAANPEDPFLRTGERRTRIDYVDRAPTSQVLPTPTTMPTYEYRCPKGHDFDVFQKMSDPPGAKCPRCGRAAERVISAGAGFIFKGEGFYITDSRSDEYKKKASVENPAGDAGAPKKDAAAPKGAKEGGGKEGGGAESGSGKEKEKPGAADSREA